MFSSVPYAKLFSSVSRYSSDASENRIARMNSRTPDICVEGLIVVDPCKPRLPVDRDYQCSFAVVFTQFRAGISCRRVDRIERHVLAARGGTQAWIEFDVSTATPVYKLKRKRPIASKREENGIERITTEACSTYGSISDGREFGLVRRGIRNRFGQQPETALSFDRKFGGEYRRPPATRRPIVRRRCVFSKFKDVR